MLAFNFVLQFFASKFRNWTGFYKAFFHSNCL